ncbi:sortase B [Paenibacillus tianmuensis]|uniref:Sortase B n=1 Tax=Paenibacillus tianmuensis TaxID=624147 RepID=A0A1G4RGW4_9BACL|nr:class B sortase [Paenibacillus tianmuensis]SCW55881.1 sortase B [Paenibacillus tianmuensis]
MNIRRWLTPLCLGLMLFSGYELAGIFRSYHDNRVVMAEARQLYGHAEPEPPLTEAVEPLGDALEAPKGEFPKEARAQFKALLDVNPDVVGWVRIANTVIDYPVVQGKDNAYYLNRNYKGEEAGAGSIFLDFRNDIGKAQPNTVIYGHRMKDGSMFGDLKKFLKEDFYKKNLTFQYDTLYHSYRAEIFSVYPATADLNYIQTGFESEQKYAAFLQDLQERSLYKTDTALGADDRILTLSTCDYTLDPAKGRLIIHAKLIEQD